MRGQFQGRRSSFRWLMRGQLHVDCGVHFMRREPLTSLLWRQLHEADSVFLLFVMVYIPIFVNALL